MWHVGIRAPQAGIRRWRVCNRPWSDDNRLLRSWFASRQSAAGRVPAGWPTGCWPPQIGGSMPQFPRREPEMAMLARLVTDGLAKAREDFPSPPVPASELERKLAAYEAAKVSAAALEGQLRELYVAKDQVLEDLMS